jgi:hypothetical protein
MACGAFTPMRHINRPVCVPRGRLGTQGGSARAVGESRQRHMAPECPETAKPKRDETERGGHAMGQTTRRDTMEMERWRNWT